MLPARERLVGSTDQARAHAQTLYARVALASVTSHQTARHHFPYLVKNKRCVVVYMQQEALSMVVVSLLVNIRYGMYTDY